QVTEAADMTFDNSYTASGTLELKGTKTIKNRKFQTGDKWTFTVSADKQKAPLPTNKEITINPTDGKEFSLDFGTITFGLNDIGETYIYTIAETGEVKGVTNDNETHTVTVEVSDNGNGTLKINAKYSDDALFGLISGLKFTNTYNRKGEYNLVAHKTIEGRKFKLGDNWKFTVTGTADAEDVNVPMPERSEVTIRPMSGTLADIDFGKIEFKDEHAGHEFTYTIFEVEGNIEGIDYDKNSYSVKVKVDAVDGGLIITPTYVDEEKKLTFTNTYSATGEITLAGKKVIQGRDFEDGDTWTFTVSGVEKDGQAEIVPMPSTTSVIINPKNGTNTPIDFGTITYSEKDDGKTYVYTITESGEVEGVTNDAKVHTVTVKVEDNKDETLSITVKSSDGGEEFEFTNTYSVSTPTPGTPAPTTTPTATPETTATPGTTPSTTETPAPSATPETTPEATATPAVTPDQTPAPTTTPSVEETPVPENTPNPEGTPNPIVTPGNNPAPTPRGSVLGARKVRVGGTRAAVLGARRGADFAVLGKRRRPSTGDSMALLIWIITMSVAMGGAVTSSVLLSLENGRKRRRRS
ncbi:MAG: hypothetical protein NC489_27400, partial [Ruminococcus flavefaciens]|nr:hypothetical protein [Ruminococcus flavefaciens]